MFDKSTLSKQVCQLLLSLIVAPKFPSDSGDISLTALPLLLQGFCLTKRICFSHKALVKPCEEPSF